MPAADRKVVDRAVREATQRPLNAANSESKTVYAYTPDSIYTLYGAPGRVIDIQLQPGEKLSGPVIAGDTVRWVVGTTNSRNGASAITHVLVKPIMAGIETNFIITTDRHSYHLIAKSLNRNFLPTVSWTYPHDEMAKFATYSQEGEGGVESLVTDGISPDKLNFKYKIDPDDEYPWTPVRVFDDGSKTYIQMSRNMKNTEAPVFFVKDKRGLNLVNYRVKGEYYIVDRLFDEGEFRCGKDACRQYQERQAVVTLRILTGDNPDPEKKRQEGVMSDEETRNKVDDQEEGKDTPSPLSIPKIAVSRINRKIVMALLLIFGSLAALSLIWAFSPNKTINGKSGKPEDSAKQTPTLPENVVDSPSSYRELAAEG